MPEENSHKKIRVNVHNDVFGNVWAKFIFGPAMFLVLVMLLIVTVLDYRAKLVFDNNQQIIVQTLTNFIQEERLNNRKLIESADLSYEQNRETEARTDHALDSMQRALNDMKTLNSHVEDEIETFQRKFNQQDGKP